MSAPIIDSLPLPPHSQEAEHALLGALLANPEAFHLIEPPLEPGDFYSYANRLIYQAIFSLDSQAAPHPQALASSTTQSSSFQAMPCLR